MAVPLGWDEDQQASEAADYLASVRAERQSRHQPAAAAAGAVRPDGAGNIIPVA